MYILLAISLNISLVLMTKKEIGENLWLIWNPDSLSDWVRTFWFPFFIIVSFLLFKKNCSCMYFPILQKFPVLCWLRKKINEGNLWLVWKYFSRAVTNYEAPYTRNSMVLIHDYLRLHVILKFPLNIQFLGLFYQRKTILYYHWTSNDNS